MRTFFLRLYYFFMPKNELIATDLLDLIVQLQEKQRFLEARLEDVSDYCSFQEEKIQKLMQGVKREPTASKDE